MTRIERRKITLKNAEKLLEDTISGKISEKKARDMYNDIATKKMLPTFWQLE